jgi:AraC-like DNA-binding protein
MEQLTVDNTMPITAERHWAGLAVSRGIGRHPTRVIDTYELIYVRSGILDVREEERKFTVGAGEALLFWPGRKHGGVLDYPPDLEFFWIHFRTNTSAGSSSGLVIPQQTVVKNGEFLESLFRHYLNEYCGTSFDQVSASLLVWLMLSEVARQADAPEPHGSAAILAGRADAYICTHFQKQLSTSSVADEMPCNPRYLSRVYREVYGHTVTEAIHRRRMDYARRLLVESSMNVNEIAIACGIDDPSYFLKLFKRQTGMTAIAFRLMYAQTNVVTE